MKPRMENDAFRSRYQGYHPFYEENHNKIIDGERAYKSYGYTIKA
jgi:hypothetical protein